MRFSGEGVAVLSLCFSFVRSLLHVLQQVPPLLHGTTAYEECNGPKLVCINSHKDILVGCDSYTDREEDDSYRLGHE
jgi:hypothetical protein